MKFALQHSNKIEALILYGGNLDTKMTCIPLSNSIILLAKVFLCGGKGHKPDVYMYER